MFQYYSWGIRKLSGVFLLGSGETFSAKLVKSPCAGWDDLRWKLFSGFKCFQIYPKNDSRANLCAIFVVVQKILIWIRPKIRGDQVNTQRFYRFISEECPKSFADLFYGASLITTFQFSTGLFKSAQT
jgi:hypothetical protein